jgi:DNA-directed RNA polymerase subunit M/transcription elongation factor TFIIS
MELRTVWSVRDALKLQGILDTAGIPFFMGPEKATGVDGVTSDFANGISVQIMNIGWPLARGVMPYYEPEDDPTSKELDELGEAVVECPQCHSREVVFEGRSSTLVVSANDPSQKYRWSCDACGNEWEDDGISKEE